MWKYIKKYLPFMLLAALCMVMEVAGDLLQPTIMTSIVDDGVLGVNTGGVGDMEVILHSGLLMLLLVALGGLGGGLCSVFANIAGENAGNLMRKDVFRQIMGLSFPQIDALGTGSLITRVTNDITQVQNMLMMFVRGMIRTGLTFFGSIWFMFRLYPRFGVIVLCALPFTAGIMFLCLRYADPKYTRMQKELDAVNSIMQEDVSGIRLIKAAVRSGYEKLRFGSANDALVGTQLSVLTVFALMTPAMNLIMYAAVVLILLTGAGPVAAGATTPGAVMGAITYTTQLLSSIMLLVMLFQNLSRGRASWRRIREILDTAPELADGQFQGEAPERGTVELRDVSFTYPGGNEPVLSHVNLKIRQGETVGIMGATGCGKTTLVSLIPRFYDADGGQILVDGVDVREYALRALRDKVAVALQKTELFGDTIEGNIRWGAQDATPQEIRDAASAAQAEDFISAMPLGYETPVAERGMSLSGGQRQRVGIARALLKNAEILILDDATSALDLKTEAKLFDALGRERGSMTRIIVAQRVASVKGADRIAVLDGGTVAAFAPHSELMRTCAVYRDIYNSQLGEREDGNG